jgi:hypothetical protein
VLSCGNSEIHVKEVIMPNANISRAHILLQLRRREKSEELLNLLIHILSLQQVNFIIDFILIMKSVWDQSGP